MGRYREIWGDIGTDESMVLPHPASSELPTLPAPRIAGYTQPAEAILPRSTCSGLGSGSGLGLGLGSGLGSGSGLGLGFGSGLGSGLELGSWLLAEEHLLCCLGGRWAGAPLLGVVGSGVRRRLGDGGLLCRGCGDP